jgi:hypothetical protein
MTAFNGITGDMEVHPRRGLTESTARIGERILKQWTYLCEADHCFAVGYSQVSAARAEEQVLARHSCPAPMRYSMIPTGKTPIEKLWDTGDLAVRALRSGGSYPHERYTEEQTQGFVAGIAEAIAIASVGCGLWRDPMDVLRELKRRWDMHQGTIPWSPTPGYRFNPGMSTATPDDTDKVTLDRVAPHGARILVYDDGTGWIQIPGYHQIRVRQEEGKYTAAVPTTDDVISHGGVGGLLTMMGARLGITKHVPLTRHVQNYHTGENYVYEVPTTGASTETPIVARSYSTKTLLGDAAPARKSARTKAPRKAAPAEPPVPPRVLSDEDKATMKAAFAKGATLESLAMVYDVSTFKVKSIVDPAKPVVAPVIPLF